AEDHLFARQEVKVLAPEVLYDSLCQALEVDDLAGKAPPRAARRNRRFSGLTGSKKMSRRSHEAEADQGSSQNKERLLDLAVPIRSQAQLAEAMKPRNPPLHPPTDPAHPPPLRVPP